MKLRVKRLFKYMWDNVTTHQLLPGEYDVPKDVSERTALLAIQLGAAVWINLKPAPKKVAPENKVVKVAENKTKKKKVNRKK
jgi:hypothetical protein